MSQSLLEVCWGKSFIDENEEQYWLPVWIHLIDSYAASQIVADWMPDNCQRILLKDLNLSIDELEEFIGWLAATHDLGKLTSGFYYRDSVMHRTRSLYKRMAQSELPDGTKLVFDTDKSLATPRHEAGSAVALQRVIENITNREYTGREKERLHHLLSIISGHHGNPTMKEFREADRYSKYDKFNIWNILQDEMYAFLDMQLFKGKSHNLLIKVLSNDISPRSSVLLTSLLIMSDWLASTPDNYPLIPFDVIPSMQDQDFINSRLYRNKSISDLGVNERYTTPMISESENIHQVFERRFGFTPNILQTAILDAIDYKRDQADGNPDALRDIYIIEAPMGYGKTEAALIAAEYINALTGQSGMFFGLPTMATANAIYSRFYNYLQSFGEEFTEDMEGYTLSLQHSKAHLSEEARSINEKARKDEDFILLPANFFHGKHTKPLNNFIVGTVDQFLTVSLKVKYSFWRHLGLASKTVILDEIHSLDGFMLGFLKTSLKWAANYGVPVILITATLDESLKNDLLKAYRSGKE